MAEMSPAQRMKVAISFQEPDEVPLGLLPIPPRHFRELAGLTMEEYQDPDKRLAAQIDFYEHKFPQVVPFFGTFWEMNSLGRAYGFRSSYADIQSDKSDLTLERVKQIEPLDPYRNEVLVRSMEEVQWLADHIPSTLLAKHGNLMFQLPCIGPLHFCGAMLGWPEMFRLLKQDPALILHICEVNRQTQVAYIKAMESAFRDRFGFHPGLIHMTDEVIPFVSYADLERFFLSFAQPVYQASSSEVKNFHCDNDVSHIPDIMIEMGCNSYRGNFSDYRVLKQLFKGKVALWGNIHALRLLVEGSPEQVEEACRLAILDLAPGGGFVLSSGGGFSPSTPLENIKAMARAVEQYGHYPIPAGPPDRPHYIVPGLAIPPPPSEASRETPEEPLLVSLSSALVAGDEAKAVQAVDALLAGGMPPEQVLQEGIVKGAQLVTDSFYRKEYFMPEFVACGNTLKATISRLRPHLGGKSSPSKVVLGTIQGNIMQCGITIIEVILTGAGLEVHNLGSNTSPERFVERAASLGASIIAIGAYTRERLETVAEVVKLCRERNLPVKTIGGGMAFTRESALSIGLDDYAANAYEARQKTLTLIRGTS
jgi:5-methyltetrahydrofolate--homocysteine methyltransferase